MGLEKWGFHVKPARANKPEEVYSSKSLDHIPNVANNILLLHAITGCDTVSATYFQGKKIFFNTFQSNPDLLSHVEKFNEMNLPSDEIIEHGCQLLLAMYGAPLSFRKPKVPPQYKPNTIQLAETYRFRMYLMAVSKIKKIHIGKILPTVDAITQHLKRVYLQVQNWLLGEENNQMNALEWGWELKDNILVPIKMTKAAGPPSVMALIFCGCQKGCGNLCGCRRQGLRCSVACKNCLGATCSNIEAFTNADADVDEYNEEENDSDENDNIDNETCE